MPAVRGFIFWTLPCIPRRLLETGGDFQLTDLTPQRYVLVVGPQADSSRPLLDEQGKTRIIDVKAGEMVQLGQVKVSK